MGIQLGSLTIEDPVFLAPMSGVTDRPFRRLVRSLGGGMVVSEMIASGEMIRAAARSRRTSTDCAAEQPLIVQLAGCDPETMAAAARLNADRGAAAIDINFGCPVKKVVGKLAGAALMCDETLAARILEAVVRAVDLPVTLKMRLGWEPGDGAALRIARIAEAAGIRMLTVHGRYRSQFYAGTADWAAIRAVKAAVGIPVIANGDVATLAAVDRCLAVSGADGVMIGRGAQGRPWLIARAAAHLAGRPPPPAPEGAALLALVERHYEALLAEYGWERGVRVARKHLGWYAAGRPGAAGFRAAVNALTEPDAVRQSLRRFFLSPTETLAA
ncbi:MAG: tRNA dihydrouridine synthase DusB [Alphaproteobacteria bacterium]|jgi:tRNA-dihydrouridine synthase B|nr:tRNA dihydrouridine synthase DusB [Alphaproteobacteria bacterium]